MTSIIQPYILNLQSISDKLPMLAKEAILKNKQDILDLIRNKQLGIGENSYGQPLSWQDGQNSGNGFYTQATENIAHGSIGQAQGFVQPRKPKRAGQPYNFSWTNSTFDTMNLDTATEGSFHIFTADGKQSLLEDIYGEIFQLTPEHNTWVNENIILPYLYEYLFQNMMKV